MKLLLLIVLAIFDWSNGSVIPVATTYAVPATPVATSYQAVVRNVNRVYVPTVPAVSTVAYPSYPAYPAYSTTWGTYPYHYRYGYGYPYGYQSTYPITYGHSVW